MKNSVIRIGITGGIGSGKSYVSEILRKRGVPVFDSDSEAKSLMVCNQHIISSLKKLLGDDVYINGQINKPLMASFLFSSAENANKINAIVHPYVKNEFISWAEKKHVEGHDVVSIESAILIEAGFDDVVDVVITVCAPLETRISRVIGRDGTTCEKVLARINSQMDERLRLAKSDFIIENDGKTPIEPQLNTIFSALQSKR